MTRKDFSMSIKTYLSSIASYWRNVPRSEESIQEASVSPEATTEVSYESVWMQQRPYIPSLLYESEDRNDPTVGFIIPVIHWTWVIPSDQNSDKELYSRGIGRSRGNTTIGQVTKIKILSVVTDPRIVKYLQLLRPECEYKQPVYHCAALDGLERIDNTGTQAYKGFRFFLAHSMACDMINDYLDTDNPDRMVVFTDWYRRMGHLIETKVG